MQCCIKNKVYLPYAILRYSSRPTMLSDCNKNRRYKIKFTFKWHGLITANLLAKTKLPLTFQLCRTRLHILESLNICRRRQLKSPFIFINKTCICILTNVCPQTRAAHMGSVISPLSGRQDTTTAMLQDRQNSKPRLQPKRQCLSFPAE